MPTTTPLVSICLPNFNTRPYLPARMESILAQTHTDWELVVLDGQSTDGSWEYFQTFAGDPRVHLHQLPPGGLFPDWNRCLRLARGKYIHIATSDDVESPGFQAALLDLLERSERPALAYCAFREIDENGADIPGRGPEELQPLFPPPEGPVIRPRELELFHTLTAWPTWRTLNAVIFRRDLLESPRGFFPEDMGKIADNQWSYYAALAGPAGYTPEVLAGWRRHAAQATDPRFGRARLAWDYALCAERVALFLRENAAEIPAHWPQVLGWRERILAYRLRYIREFAGLDRATLKADPRRFARAAAWHWRHDRAYFFRQATRGFGYPPEIFGEQEPLRQQFAALSTLFALPSQQALPILGATS